MPIIIAFNTASCRGVYKNARMHAYLPLYERVTGAYNFIAYN